MADEEFTTRTEPIDPWVAIGCNGGCSKPAQWQEAVFCKDKRLPVKIGHCGDPDCQKNAVKKALEMAPHSTVQRLTEAFHSRGAEGFIT